jgi:nucleolar complex protein 3
MSDEEELDYDFALLATSLGYESDEDRVRIKKETEVSRLPIKVGGRLVFPTEIPDESSGKKPKEVPMVDMKASQKEPKKSAGEKKSRTLNQIKNELAELATLILEDPQEHIKSLTKLHMNTSREEGVQLQILTQLRVYLDLIPLYRIVSYPESLDKLSKQVKQQRMFEQTLLNSYQSYLLYLEKLVRNNKSSNVKRKAMQCFCELLEKVYFNYGKNVLTMVVEGVVMADLEIIKMCSSALEKLFDHQLDKTPSESEWILDGVKSLVDRVKKSNHEVHPIALQPLLSLRIVLPETKESRHYEKKTPEQKELSKDGLNGKRKKEHLSKQQKKKQKVLKEVEREMQEAETQISHEEIEKRATEMVTVVMACYIRFLKLKPKSRCLEMVLKGIVKFVKYVNIDMIGDVTKCLKDVALQLEVTEEGNSVMRRWNFSRSLKCLVTGLEVIESTQGVLELDMTDFYDSIFRLIWTCIRSFDKNKMEDSDVRHVLRALEFMLLKHRKTPLERISMYTKRILMLSCLLPTEYAIDILKMVKRAIGRGLDGLESEDGWAFIGLGTGFVTSTGKGIVGELMTEKPSGVGVSVGMWELPLLSVCHSNIRHIIILPFNYWPAIYAANK